MVVVPFTGVGIEMFTMIIRSDLKVERVTSPVPLFESDVTSPDVSACLNSYSKKIIERIFQGEIDSHSKFLSCIAEEWGYCFKKNIWTTIDVF